MLQLLDWLASLPAILLFVVVAVAAFIENIFPPLPADTAIALGAFVAARGGSSVVGIWLATMVGNVGGAMLMYYFGHRFGLPWLQRKFPTIFASSAEQKFEQQYQRYGIPGLVVSRFLPGVRAIVPPIAGAMHIGALRAVLAMTLASGVWYAIVSVLAFRAGEDADALLATIASSQKNVGIVAAIIISLAVLVWLWRRKRVST
jgi:membrane protein DedA with SNARE-associated domain